MIMGSNGKYHILATLTFFDYTKHKDSTKSAPLSAASLARAKKIKVKIELLSV